MHAPFIFEAPDVALFKKTKGNPGNGFMYKPFILLDQTLKCSDIIIDAGG